MCVLRFVFSSGRVSLGAGGAGRAGGVGWGGVAGGNDKGNQCGISLHIKDYSIVSDYCGMICYVMVVPVIRIVVYVSIVWYVI